MGKYRKAVFDVNNKPQLRPDMKYVWSKRRFDNRKPDIQSKNEHSQDLAIIASVMNYLYPETPYYIEQEYHTWIEDYCEVLHCGLTKKGKFYKQEVYFDTCCVINNVILLVESDDRSHYDEDYCKSNGYNYFAIKARDRIKDIWCRQNNICLLRLPYYLTIKEKSRIVSETIKNLSK